MPEQAPDRDFEAERAAIGHRAAGKKDPESQALCEPKQTSLPHC